MPPYIPVVTRRELLRILRRLNFAEGEGGDHTVFRHWRLGLITEIPRHSGEVSPRLVGVIISQIGLSRAEFDEVRRRRGRIPDRFRD